MRLWRLSGRQSATAFDGGYGLHFDGRWNTVGHAVTYCSTSPSLCVLEKLVHIEDPTLMPELVMVAYEAPASVLAETIHVAELPQDWRRDEGWTQARGDEWHHARSTPLLQVPSAIVPIEGSPDVNVIVNHNHPDSPAIRIVATIPFVLDPRLF